MIERLRTIKKIALYGSEVNDKVIEALCLYCKDLNGLYLEQTVSISEKSFEKLFDTLSITYFTAKNCVNVDDHVMKYLVDKRGNTLKELKLPGTSVTVDCYHYIMEKCTNIESIEPHKEINSNTISESLPNLQHLALNSCNWSDVPSFPNLKSLYFPLSN